tara:strand:- start:14 stop:511 length:498 start_codon:yes stop_codon:yes gene_type:complete
MKKALILGRFQPLHLGHLNIIHEVMKEGLLPIIGIGSSQEGNTANNPFTSKERMEMVRTIMDGLDKAYEIYNIPDINDNDKYVTHLETFIPEFDYIYSGNPLVQRLFKEAGHHVVSPEFVNREVWEGSSIRQAMTEGDDWERAVPPQIVDKIHTLNGTERLKRLS